ncbi:MAG: Cu(I)/Ag(I) efflux system membrane protein CusA/SilA [Phycisphaerales bacterium]|jgi:Cu(I)/Ag(I) efflux system membrane protein CusA/SilA
MSETPRGSETSKPARGPVGRLIRLCMEHRLVVFIVYGAAILMGVLVAPFDWDVAGLPRDPVPVDAIPDIGENQQIVFTEWPGRSPQDIDDQISYPLTVALLGMPGVKDIRSYSVFGFSTIYVVFDEDIEYYWSRSRVLEKLSSLPAGTLPGGVSPTLGPDATALGQVFWYTLEGRDEQGQPTGGWGPDELRSIQDFTVRPSLAGVEGVSEVASIGGFVREYQVDVNPDAMRAMGVTLEQVIAAVRQSNLDVGARTMEINRAEYIVRGVGFIRSVSDLEQTAITARDGNPILVSDIAKVGLGPALRRGVLTRDGEEAVGGVVVARYGENPLATIQRVKRQIATVAPGLPSKVLEGGAVSRVTIVPFYDRSGLIGETLETLNSAIEQQILVTFIVVVLMVMHLRSSLLIGAMLPITVLLAFIGMKRFHVDANIVALSGIAIAIGTIVDVGIVICENILRKLDEAGEAEPRFEVIYEACAEVGGAVLTAVATTVVGFLPVFAMQAAEGKLFKPLAYTKTFALIASIIIALTLLPVLAHLLLGSPARSKLARTLGACALIVAGLALLIFSQPVVGMLLAGLGVYTLSRSVIPEGVDRVLRWSVNLVAVGVVLVVLARSWEPLGPAGGGGAGAVKNAGFIAVLVGGVLLAFWGMRLAFPRMLAWALEHKLVALSPAIGLVVVGATIWLGFSRVWGWLPDRVLESSPAVRLAHVAPGLGKEFMPSFDEGSFLYMPTMMPHVSIGEATDVLKELDRRILSVPEVESSVGKIGRVDSPLDPAPISMVETMITYKSEYRTDERGHRLAFAFDSESDGFVRDAAGELIADKRGRPFRQWRDEITSAQGIWDEIVAAARMPGVTSAPKLQPIETRIIMLQSGFRAPMGVKVYGPDLESIEAFGLELEALLKQVPSVQPDAVFADRVVGKPYLEIEIDRARIARYGIQIADVQEVIEVAIGGKPLTMTVEGRERYPVRVRYLRELRDEPESLAGILVPTPEGAQVPLGELATLEYRRGPQMIKSEDTFLVSYVLFDKRAGQAEGTVVEDAQRLIRSMIDSGELVVPAGVSYEFAGSYKSQIRAAERLRLVLPLSLAIIFMLIYFQFKDAGIAFMVFSGVFVAWSGGFLMLWLYSQPWFLDVHLLGVNLRELFQVRPYNLSVAVWVGFLALFGIATDDGVIMATRIKRSLAELGPGVRTIDAVREAVVGGGRLRIRAAVMTTATTVLALLPVLTSTGKGADIMIPMAIPVFGGMVVASLTWFVVPILYARREEWRARLSSRASSE